MPVLKFDYNAKLLEIETKHNITFKYKDRLHSKTSLSFDCTEENCNNICRRTCGNILKDECCKCRYHLLHYNKIKQYGTIEEVMKKIDNVVKNNTPEILTSEGLQQENLFQAINYHKIYIKKLQIKYDYNKFMQQKGHPILKNKIEELVKQHGAKVLFWDWIKQNTDEDLYIKFNYASTVNKDLLLKPLAKEFKVYDDWNKIRKIQLHKDKSKRFATKKQERHIDAINTFRKLYNENGIQVFNIEWLNINTPSLYKTFRYCRIKLEHLSKEFGCHNEYTTLRQNIITESAGRNIRTKENFDKDANEIYQKYKCFPAMSILRMNGYKMFVSDLYNKNFATLEELNQKFYISPDTALTARNGFIMDSQCETCLVNFLYTRGIKMTKGRYYTNSYTQNTGRKGIYDLHFISPITDNEISVEIWGGAYSNNRQDAYNNKRKDKEKSHINDNTFLGIEHDDCYNESTLISILEPYIGVIEPYIFENEKDKTISCTKWNLIAGIEKGATYIMENNNNIIPSVNWMQCTYNYKNRPREDWETTNHFNIMSFSYAIHRFGGILKVRQLMDVKYVRRKYVDFRSIENITHFIKKIYNKYKKFPNDILKEVRNDEYAIKTGKIINPRSEEDEILYKKCVNLIRIMTDNRQSTINKSIYKNICNQIQQHQ